MVGLPMEDIRGKTARDVFRNDPELVAEIEDEDERLMRRGHAEATVRIRKIRRADGTTRYGLSSKIPIRNEQGRFEKILGLICKRGRPSLEFAKPGAVRLLFSGYGAS